jgi:hypothetical protein
MYFGLMRHARERGCTRFDFGRSKAGTGAAAFKKNWGFEPEPLTYFTRTADGTAPRASQSARSEIQPSGKGVEAPAAMARQSRRSVDREGLG